MTQRTATELTGEDRLLALAALVILAGLVGVALRVAGKRLPDLWRGKDGRPSTSQFQAILWTLVVVWALLALVLGEWWGGGDRQSALSAGWDAFNGAMNKDTFEEDYLWLLGIPIATAVGAKAITSTKVANGTVVKPAAAADAATGAKAQCKHLLGDDDGNPAPLDFQLVLFNLLLVLVFLGEFLSDPSGGLPRLPDTLLGVALVSSGGYTLNKGLERTVGPAISSVRPSRIALGALPAAIDIYGGPFTTRAADTAVATDAETPRPAASGVSLAGTRLEIAHWARDHVQALVPGREQAEQLGLPVGTGELVVFDYRGIASEPQKVELVEAPAGTDRPSDELLSTDAIQLLEAQLADHRATEAQEDELVAATVPAGGEPGDSELTDDDVHPEDPGEV